MKRERTITQAAIEVLKHSGKTLTVSEIYAKIIEHSLYEFHAQDPLSVLGLSLEDMLTVLIIPQHPLRNSFHTTKRAALLVLQVEPQNKRTAKKI